VTAGGSGGGAGEAIDAESAVDDGSTPVVAPHAAISGSMPATRIPEIKRFM
jgi:hypothetical protein